MLFPPTFLKEKAEAYAREGGLYALTAREQVVADHKGNDVRNVVTNIDHEIDTLITTHIHKDFPEHHVYSEERGGEVSSSGYLWSIDPIDGTSNYVRGIPHYATCVSVLYEGNVVGSAIYNPVTDECFTFDTVGGARLNGGKISCSLVTELKDAYVNFHPGRKPEMRAWGGSLKVLFLGEAFKSLNLGSAALDLCYLACGRFDLVIYGTLTTLDVAGALTMVRQSGGEVYAYGGDTPIEMSPFPQQIVGACSPSLLADFYARENSR